MVNNNELSQSTMDGVVKVLEEANTEYVFGMPGGYMGKLYDSLYNSNITPILVRHEQTATIMAETYGRLTRKPGVFTAQGAWTLSNGMMGLIEAVQGSSPMLVLTDMTDNAPFSHHGSYQVGTGEFGGYDVKKAVESTTKYSTVVHDSHQAVQSVQLAIKHSIVGNPGPSAVILHSSALDGVIEEDKLPTIYNTQKYLVDSNNAIDQKLLEEVSDVLLTAEKPFIIAGNGVKVADAFEELEELSTILNIPVGTTAQGKSSIKETHPNSVGVIGNWGQEAGNKLLSEADVILVVGSKLAPTDTCNHSKELIDPDRQKLIQIDIEPKHSSWTVPIDIPVIGDAKYNLNYLVKLAKESSKELELDDRRKMIDEVKSEYSFMYTEEMESTETPIKPQRVLKELNDFMDEESILTLDAGENRVFAVHYFKSKSPGSIIMPGSAGGMGYALPSALAAKLVHPKKKVFALAGDGGFAMTMNALITAVQYELPIVCIVMNNSSLGWVKNAQGDKQIASEFNETDFAGIAHAMGCNSIKVENADDLQNAFQNAIDSESPSVIDVRTTDKESYKQVMSKLAKSLED